MHIGVTGASGFIGRHLSEHLTKHGNEVTAFVRRVGSVPDAVASRVQQLELENERPIDARPGAIDCLVHVAGLAHEKSAAKAGNHSDIYDAINSRASIRLAERAARLKIRRFVFVSSISVYGQRVLGAGTEIRETSHAEPTEPYGRSKLNAENGLRETAERLGIELVIVRPALVVGPKAPGNLNTLGRLIRSGYPIPVGRPANERSYIGVNDLTQLLVKCISMPLRRAARCCWRPIPFGSVRNSSSGSLPRAWARGQGSCPCREAWPGSPGS
jgi:nucleoside-diphosphate-sugar epimerase